MRGCCCSVSRHSCPTLLLFSCQSTHPPTGVCKNVIIDIATVRILLTTAVHFHIVLNCVSLYLERRVPCGRMVVGSTTTCEISAYHHQSYEFDFLSWRGVFDAQHSVIKFVSGMWQVGRFIRVLRFPQPIKLTPRYNGNIVESGTKQHNHRIYWIKYGALFISRRVGTNINNVLQKSQRAPIH